MANSIERFRSKRLAPIANLLVWGLAVVAIAIAANSLRRPSAPAPSLLDRKIAIVDFDNVPLRNALKQLGSAVGANVNFDQPGLRTVTVDFGRPVSLHARDVELRVVLECLNPAQGLSPVMLNPGWVMQQNGNNLQVTAFSSPAMTVRIYDVDDLVQHMHAVTFPLSGLFQQSASSAQSQSRPVEQLMQLIEWTIKPEAWAASGGAASIATAGNRLIISGSEPLHEQVRELLRRLREADRHAPAP